MSNCPSPETLERLAFDFLEKEAASGVRTHAENCVSCAGRLKSLTNDAAVLSNVARGIPLPALRRPRRLWPAFAAAAAILLGVLLFRPLFEPRAEEICALTESHDSFRKETSYLLQADGPGKMMPQAVPEGLNKNFNVELFDPLPGFDDFGDADELLVIVNKPFKSGSGDRGLYAGRMGKKSPLRSSSPATDPDTSGRETHPTLPPATQGTLRARDADGKIIGEFPLKHTEVLADVAGTLARTIVEQEYANSYQQAIEAVYVFPLPTLAAVNDFVMEIGDRKIVGIVRPREEAEMIYHEARARGQTAALLTQERPNLFTQNVANIEPGGTVKIRITYFETLKYERGYFEYLFPMVVGPRYIPGTPQPTPGNRESGGGTSPSTTQVPDADRITPPVLAPEQRSGHDIGLTLRLDAGLPIRDLVSIAHTVDVTEQGASRRTLRLSAADSIPNRDFVLRWKIAGDRPEFGLLAHRAGNGGFFTLLMQPPLQPADDQVTPREITFILDVSGSMNGLPIEMSKEIISRTLDKMRKEDCFNLFFFAGSNGQLWEKPMPNTPENVAAARRFLDGVHGAGGTEMLAGVQRALHADHDPKFLQMYVFLTDGYVGNEEQIIKVVKEERGDARFFAFGVGSSVNRFLIDGIGVHGGGQSHVVLPREKDHAAKAVDRFYEAIDSPVLVDIEVDWKGLPVQDVYPRRIGDLFAGQTISLVGRFTGPAKGTAVVRGRVGARRVEFPVAIDLPREEKEHAALAPVWARHRIHELSKEKLTADEARQGQIAKSITDLAVEFRLVSEYTAFVAVDESRIVGNGKPLRILQPLELPEGVSYEGVFGEKPAGAPVRIAAWGLSLQETEKGEVRVGAVDPGSPAAHAGIVPGATLKVLNRNLVQSLRHLESLLLQTRAGTVTVEFAPGGAVALPAP